MSFGGVPVRSAWVCGTFEDDRERVLVTDGTAQVTLAPRRLTLVRLCEA